MTNFSQYLYTLIAPATFSRAHDSLIHWDLSLWLGKKKMIKLVAPILVAFMCLSGGNASAATVTFSGITGFPQAGPYIEQGFHFTSSADGNFAAGYVNGFVGAYAQPTIITATTMSGNPFSVTSLDISNANTGNSITFRFTGTFAAGGTITQSFSPAPNSTTPMTAMLTGFNGLSSLTWDGGGPSTFFGPWDNFVATESTVPVPAAVWLFGSGLIGLIGVARRKKS